jgi:hypothetical protein
MLSQATGTDLRACPSLRWKRPWRGAREESRKRDPFRTPGTVPWIQTKRKLNLRYVLSLEAFGSLLDFELNKLAFVQRLVSVHLNGGEVNEDVLP